MNFTDLYNLLMRNGGASLGDAIVRQLAAFGLAESGGDATVRRYCDGGGYCLITRNGRTTREREASGQSPEDSVGLWQINRRAWNYPASLLQNPDFNAKIAVEAFKKQGFNAWRTTFKSGKYKKYLKGNNENLTYTPNSSVFAPVEFNPNAQIFGEKNRYLIAFGILVLIFVFAFND